MIYRNYSDIKRASLASWNWCHGSDQIYPGPRWLGNTYQDVRRSMQPSPYAVAFIWAVTDGLPCLDEIFLYEPIQLFSADMRIRDIGIALPICLTCIWRLLCADWGCLSSHHWAKCEWRVSLVTNESINRQYIWRRGTNIDPTLIWAPLLEASRSRRLN